MEVLRNRFDFTTQPFLHKCAEKLIRLILLVVRPIVIWPTLKVLEIFGLLPFPHDISYFKLAVLVALFLSTWFLSIPYVILIFTIGLPVWAIDFFLYRCETEEAGLPSKPLPPTGARHGVRKFLASRFIQSSFFSSDLCDVSHMRGKGTAYLGDEFPRRIGIRPATLKGLPHRQYDQRPSREMFARAENIVFVETFGSMEGLESGCISLSEGTGAKAVRFLNPNSHCVPAQKGEFCHIHNADGSYHCALSQADAYEVINRGWGELWPNACLTDKYQSVVLLYAAQNEHQLKVIVDILKASHKFASDTTSPCLNGYAAVNSDGHDDEESKREQTVQIGGGIVHPAPEYGDDDDEEFLATPTVESPAAVGLETKAVPIRSVGRAGINVPASMSDESLFATDPVPQGTGLGGIDVVPDDLPEVSPLDTGVQATVSVGEDSADGQTEDVADDDRDEKEADAALPSRLSGESDSASLERLLDGRPVTGNLEVIVVSAKNLEPKDLNHKSDPYVTLRLDDDDTTQKRTKVKKKTLSPLWNETFNFFVVDARQQMLNLEVKDHDVISKDDLHGTLSIPIQEILREGTYTNRPETPYYKRNATYSIAGSLGALKLKMKFAPQSSPAI